MHAVRIVFGAGWAVFWLYWLIAASSMKRGRVSWSREAVVRLVLVAVVVVLVRVRAFRVHGGNASSWRVALGLLLFAAGLGFAVWARRHIGRNWGTPMMQKDDPELVTSGPYRYVRHPIYSGILLAGVGTAFGLGWEWLVVTAVAGAYFIYSATVEERFMTERFPDSYPAYRASTRMLVPFVL